MNDSDRKRERPAAAPLAGYLVRWGILTGCATLGLVLLSLAEDAPSKLVAGAWVAASAFAMAGLAAVAVRDLQAKVPGQPDRRPDKEVPPQRDQP